MQVNSSGISQLGVLTYIFKLIKNDRIFSSSALYRLGNYPVLVSPTEMDSFKCLFSHPKSFFPVGGSSQVSCRMQFALYSHYARFQVSSVFRNLSVISPNQLCTTFIATVSNLHSDNFQMKNTHRYDKTYQMECNFKCIACKDVCHCGAEAELLPCMQQSWVQSPAGQIGANPES